MPKKVITKDIVENTTQTVTVSTEPKQENQKFSRKIGPKKLLIIVLGVLAVLGIYGSYYFYSKYQMLIKNPNLEVQKESEMLISALGKLIELPANETPTIAVISDIEKLKDQPFFKNAENGDRLFAYNTAMIAILYRPRTNKIINVAPISSNQPQDLTQDTKKNEVITEPTPQ